jgi:RNA 2',3'-cyclic 3'-phosphodiesterase
MRLFLAVGAQHLGIDPTIEFKKIKIALDKRGVEHRWVPVDNLHVTLVFMGEVASELVPQLQQGLRELVATRTAFKLKLSDISAFPDERHGRVIWLGVQNSIALRELQAECLRVLKLQGFEVEERDYRPHLTLARLRSARNLSDVLSPFKRREFGQLSVEHVSLYESRLGGSYPVYEVLENFPLGGA